MIYALVGSTIRWQLSNKEMCMSCTAKQLSIAAFNPLRFLCLVIAELFLKEESVDFREETAESECNWAIIRWFDVIIVYGCITIAARNELATEVIMIWTDMAFTVGQSVSHFALY